MGKIILTYNDVYEVNRRLADLGIMFKLHLHDACGSQSFTLEPLTDNTSEEKQVEMRNVIIKCLEEKNVQIKFLENKLEFYIV